MRVNLIDTSKTVDQLDLFGSVTTIQTGEKKTYDFPEVEMLGEINTYSDVDFDRAVLKALGLEPSMDFGDEYNNLFSIETTFHGDHDLDAVHGFVADFFKRQSFDTMHSFLLKYISESESQSQVRSAIDLVSARLNGVVIGEDPIALANHFIETLIPFCKKGANVRDTLRNLARRVRHASSKSEKLAQAGTHKSVETLLSEMKEYGQPAALNYDVKLAELKSVYRSFSPSVKAEQFIRIDWRCIQTQRDVHGLVEFMVALDDSLEDDIRLRNKLIQTYHRAQRKIQSTHYVGDFSELLKQEVNEMHRRLRGCTPKHEQIIDVDCFDQDAQFDT